MRTDSKKSGTRASCPKARKNRLTAARSIFLLFSPGIILSMINTAGRKKKMNTGDEKLKAMYLLIQSI